MIFDWGPCDTQSAWTTDVVCVTGQYFHLYNTSKTQQDTNTLQLSALLVITNTPKCSVEMQVTVTQQTAE